MKLGLTEYISFQMVFRKKWGVIYCELPKVKGIWKYLYREYLLANLKLALIDCKASLASLVIPFPLFVALEELVIILPQASYALQLTFQASLGSLGEI